MATNSESEGTSTGYTLPGYKYLGPGNSLDLGEPTNQLDRIAQEHDITYSQIQAEYEDQLKNGTLEKSTLKKWATTKIRSGRKISITSIPVNTVRTI